MKIILLENVRKIGSIGEIIDVKRGFARNFLISKKKALFASKENIKEVEKTKQHLSSKDQKKKNNAKDIQEKLQIKEFEVKKLSTENKELYGSVKPTEIAKILQEKNHPGLLLQILKSFYFSLCLINLNLGNGTINEPPFFNHLYSLLINSLINPHGVTKK